MKGYVNVTYKGEINNVKIFIVEITTDYNPENIIMDIINTLMKYVKPKVET